MVIGDEQENFQKALKAVEEMGKIETNDELLNLYGLYKQATCGDLEDGQPSLSLSLPPSNVPFPSLWFHSPFFLFPFSFFLFPFFFFFFFFLFFLSFFSFFSSFFSDVFDL